MQEQKYLDIWDSICEQIRSYDEVDNSQFTAFFQRLHLQVIAGNYMMITADNAFLKGYTEKHLLHYLQRALKDIYGCEFTIDVEIDTTAAAPMPPVAQAQQQPFAQSAPAPAPSQSVPQSTVPDDAGAMDQPAAEPATANPTPANLGEFAVPQTNNQVSPIVQNQGNPIPSPQMGSQGSPIEQSQVTPTTQTTSPQVNEQNNLGSVSTSNGITSDLTFENYVIGESNRMAYSMALAVAENPGKPQLNPLFIYGRSGLGKTHLMRAIQNYAETTYTSDGQPMLKAVYVDSSQFLNEYTDATIEHSREKNSFKRFKEKYENADILLIDDVQALRDKPQTLDIVFQIFNSFIDRGKQVVLSADIAPKNIDIDERYQSRFNSGATLDIQPPEVETKLGIIKHYIETYKRTENKPSLTVPQDVQMYIAENSSSNIRELKSAVYRVIFEITLNDSKDIDVNQVSRLLENHFSGGATKRLTVSDIQKQTEAFYKVSHTEIVGKKRTKNIAHARQVAMYLCREMLDASYSAIGKEFGGKDHTTVLYSVNNVEEKIKSSKDVQEEIDFIKKQIREA